MLALQVHRSKLRYVAAGLLAPRVQGLVTAGLAPLRLVETSPPRRPTADWVRLRPRIAGICGSDLALLTGRGSTYFSPLVSFPFTPGHEVVAELLDDAPDLPRGTRVVLDPTLGCRARGVADCAACNAGTRERCAHVAAGHLAPGLQTGYCRDTGGGWAGALVAHRSQLHAIPDDLPDRAAAILEPFACALHAVERGLSGSHTPSRDQLALVTGAGTLGLLTILALRLEGWVGRILAVARHPRQRERALAMGATQVAAPEESVDAVRRLRGSHRLESERGQPFLLDGVDVAFECAGTPASLELALRTSRAGTRVVLAGLPSGGVDLAPLWFRELELVGAYAAAGGLLRALTLATDVSAPLSELVSAVYPLSRWREAIDHALAAGRLGAARIAFNPRLS